MGVTEGSLPGQRSLWASVGLLVSISILALSAAPALANVYGTDYAGVTSTIQSPTVSLVAGASGSSTVSSAAPDAATATVSSVVDLYYVPITLTNSQTSATPTGFQQQITVNPSSYTSQEASDLGNVRFCADSNCNTELYSWLESCASPCNTASSAVFWVNLGSNTIAANGGTLTIYMGFLPTAVGFDGTVAGEIGTLSATYGAYDNGGSVFSLYFNGNTPTADFNLISSTAYSLTQATVTFGTGTAVVLQLHSNGAGSNAQVPMVYNVASVAAGSSHIEEDLFQESQTSANTGVLGLGSTTTPSSYGTTGGGTSGTYAVGEWASTRNNIVYENSGAVTSAAGSTIASATWYYGEMDYVSGAASFSVYLGTSLYSHLDSITNTNPYPTTGQMYMAPFWHHTGTAVGTVYYGWMRVRAYPPSDVMPAQSTGSLTANSPSSTVPITITNSQSTATPSPFQESITFNPSAYAGREASNLGNIRFCADSGCGTQLYSWIESCTPSCTSAATSATVWVKLTSSIGAGGTLTIYMAFQSLSTNFDGNYWGEAPGLSGTYGQYDNGGNVFTDYYRGDSTTGWTVAGTAGTTASAPAGSASAFGTEALYANSASGDYMDANAGYSTSGNYVIQFYTYTTGLGNLFFSASSAGAGTMTRLDSRGGTNYVGLAKSSSWTAWYCPQTSTTLSASTWYQWSVVIAGAGTQVADYYSTSFGLGTMGTQINALGTSYTDGCGGGAETYSPQGSYIGLVGDGLGATYITYWNGIIVRAYPPNGVMPSASFGSAGLNDLLGISNGGSQSWNVNLAVASSSNTGRLYNLTIWLYTPTTTEIRLGSGVTSLTAGPAVSLPGSGALYIALYAGSTASGTTTVTLTLKVAPGSVGPYADYTIVLTVN